MAKQVRGTAKPGWFGIMGGRVYNYSDCTVLCWVQDEHPKLFMLGPHRVSPFGEDVDFVRGYCRGFPSATYHDQEVTIQSRREWVKIRNITAAALAQVSASNLGISYFDQTGLSLTPVPGAQSGGDVAVRGRFIDDAEVLDEHSGERDPRVVGDPARHTKQERMRIFIRHFLVIGNLHWGLPL